MDQSWQSLIRSHKLSPAIYICTESNYIFQIEVTKSVALILGDHTQQETSENFLA